ncbi:MAG: hypothetical protein JEZ09_18100 [Salinivirgaceae bacterium]|nr:hypothetical protein [Salinivirgaceae bacterium]
MMAIAWKDCFFDNCEDAKNILESLINTLLSQGKKTYIRWALFTFLISTIILLLMLHLLKFHKPNFTYFIGTLIMGGLGALISVLIKIKDVFINPHDRPIIILSGFSRILIGSAAGLIFYFAYKANILLSFIQDAAAEQQLYYVLLMAFVSGFSERAIPEFTSKLNESGLFIKDK